jgi:hypothetical protein
MEIFVLVVHFVLFQSIFLLFQQYIFIVLKSNLRKKGKQSRTSKHPLVQKGSLETHLNDHWRRASGASQISCLVFVGPFVDVGDRTCAPQLLPALCTPTPTGLANHAAALCVTLPPCEPPLLAALCTHFWYSAPMVFSSSLTYG